MYKRQISSSARKAAKQLVANGWASAKQVHLLQRVAEIPTAQVPELNDEQQSAVAEVIKDSHHFKSWLLHGITAVSYTHLDVYKRQI